MYDETRSGRQLILVIFPPASEFIHQHAAPSAYEAGSSDRNQAQEAV
jgi:hypothetical protein